uniref:Secreted protein n=1 Tax=Ditylenchus dipsaci TaxID=166011 RepID=A0A915EVG3_9BILA
MPICLSGLLMSLLRILLKQQGQYLGEAACEGNEDRFCKPPSTPSSFKMFWPCLPLLLLMARRRTRIR